MTRPVLGPLARDLLDSLVAEPLLTAERLAELTGRLYASVARSLVGLRRRHLVSRRGRVSLGQVAGYGGTTAWLWRITPLGIAELEQRKRAGYIPGVAASAPRITDLRALRRDGDPVVWGWVERDEPDWHAVYGHVDEAVWCLGLSVVSPSVLGVVRLEHRYLRTVPRREVTGGWGTVYQLCAGPARGVSAVTVGWCR